MAQYKTGTVSATNGSAIVTGSGTAWLANVSAGDGFTVSGTGVPYTVGSVDSDTQVTLSANYAGGTASGQSYAIWRDFTTANNIPELSQGDIETATIFTRAMRLIDGDLSAIQSDYYNTGNILGTVSQSAGVPTGAIIEQGSNANGEYVKYASGWMICTRAVSLGSQTTTAFGSVYTSTTNSFDFPAPFAGNVFSTGQGTNTAAWLVPGITAAGWFIRILTESARTVDSAHLIAIGRWF